MALWSDDEEEDFLVPYGTPLPNEEDLRAMEAAGVSRRKLIQVEEGLDRKRSKASRDLEVRDEQGRQRLHGAFRGGFSAGYYNTVGSKEGWTPGEFKSSRSTRAETKAFNPQDFMAEDELSALKKKEDELVINDEYGGKLLRSVAEKRKPSSEADRLGFIFGGGGSSGGGGTSSEETLMETIGFQVLRKLGWRPGKGVTKRKILVPVDSGRSMKEMYVASEDTPVMVLKPRNEKHGIGFDPYENARDFEAYAKQVKDTKPPEGIVSSMFAPNRGQSGKGFGIGAMEDYEDDDEDVYKGGDDGSMYYTVLYEEDELGPLQRQEKSKKKKRSTMDSYLDKTLRGGIIIGGYVPGIEGSAIDESTVSSLKLLMQRYPLPVIPIGIELRHKFRSDVDEHLKLASKEHNEDLFSAPPPKDEQVKIAADKLAAFVARNGQTFEDLARKRNSADPRLPKQFIFLRGGDGAEYYYSQLTKAIIAVQREKNKQNTSIIMPDARSKLYGEKITDQVTLNSLQQSTQDILKEGLSNTFVSSGKLEGTSVKEGAVAAVPKDDKPFASVPEKQKRYERFLSFKEYGGLQPRCPSDMTQGDFIKEEEEFEETAVRLRHGPYQDEAKIPLKYREEAGRQDASKSESSAIQDEMAKRFRTSVTDVNNADLDPDVAARAGLFGWRTRIETDWFPVHLLCKRFGLPDPHKGKAKPRGGDAASQVSQLAARLGPSTAQIQPRESAGNNKPAHSSFNSSSVVITRDDAPLAELFSNLQPENDAGEQDTAEAKIDVEAKPVDLFSAIFDARESSESESSDDDDKEEEEEKGRSGEGEQGGKSNGDNKASGTKDSLGGTRALADGGGPASDNRPGKDEHEATTDARAIAAQSIKSIVERNMAKGEPDVGRPDASASSSEDDGSKSDDDGDDESEDDKEAIREAFKEKVLRDRRKKSKLGKKKDDKKKDKKKKDKKKKEDKKDKASRKRKSSKKDDKDQSHKKKKSRH